MFIRNEVLSQYTRWILKLWYRICRYPFLVGFFICLCILILHLKLPRLSKRILFTNPEDIVQDIIKHNFKQTKLDYCLPNKKLKPTFAAVPDIDKLTYMDILESNPHICNGGQKPRGCQPLQQVAIIVTFRDREQHLKLLLHRLHQFLYYQNISYQIFVIEQVDNRTFNKGLLYNIGIIKAIESNPHFDCFILHDVDMLPENVNNYYLCDHHLRQLSSAIDEYRYHVMFSNNAGGVISISKTNLLKINGFSNQYWGWGGEDDDLSARAIVYNLSLSRPPESIGQFHSVRHVKTSHWSWEHHRILKNFVDYLEDGIESVAIAPDKFYRDFRPPVNQESFLSDATSWLRNNWLASIGNLNLCAKRLIIRYLNSHQSTSKESFDEFLKTHILSTFVLVKVTMVMNSSKWQSGNSKNDILLPKLSWIWFGQFYGWF